VLRQATQLAIEALVCVCMHVCARVRITTTTTTTRLLVLLLYYYYLLRTTDRSSSDEQVFFFCVFLCVQVIEEAPSPFIDEKTWRAMGEQAVALAKVRILP
jgi:hypothetical protein